MKRFALAVLLLSVWGCSPGNAGTIAVTMTTGNGTCSGGCSKTYTAPDADLARLIPVYQAGCNAKRNAVCTAVQVMAYAFDTLISDMVASVSDFERDALKSGAVNGYTPINPQ